MGKIKGLMKALEDEIERAEHQMKITVWYAHTVDGKTKKHEWELYIKRLQEKAAEFILLGEDRDE